MFRVFVSVNRPGKRTQLHIGQYEVVGAEEITPKIAREVISHARMLSGCVVHYSPVKGSDGEYWKPVKGYRVYASGRTRKLTF